MVGGNDCDPPPGTNTGLMFIKRGPVALDVLNAIIAYEDDAAFMKDAFWNEQSAVNNLQQSGKGGAISVSRLTLQWFPSADNKCMKPHPNSWIAHWAGCNSDPLCFRDIIIWPSFAHSPPGKYDMAMFEHL
jgi:hypothetical protein